MKSYQQKLTSSYLIIFTCFTVGILVFGYYQNKRYRIEVQESKLESYADIVHAYKEHSTQLDSLLTVLPVELRISIINSNGTVEYDNLFADLSQLKNHSQRPEFINALKTGTGTDIRKSESNNLQYLYFAKKFGNHIIRVAYPYNTQLQHYLKPDNGFFYFIIALFVIWFIFILHVSGRFSNSVKQLNNFASVLANNTQYYNNPVFPDDELGEISTKIVNAYNLLKENEKKIRLEREKLLQHIQSSAEGICFFNPDKTVDFYNGLFLQYLNVLSNNTSVQISEILNEDEFKKVNEFINSHEKEYYYETQIHKHSKEFFVRLNVFEDGSFEMILTDITRMEKTKQLKQEMTGNIAHELRTPVTSIRGYLETVLDNKLDSAKERDFLQKAYKQTKTLSDLISDMGLLTKIVEGGNSLKLKEVNIADIINRVKNDLAADLNEKNITIETDINPHFTVKANEGLIYSVFRNLTDNVISHAGENVHIVIRKYDEKDGYAYFSFSDTGKGVDEKYLNRIFERFYRANEGRTRDTGGSGLGLSIVKNAIAFHKGNITAKNRNGGGLEFLFNISNQKTGINQTKSTN